MTMSCPQVQYLLRRSTRVSGMEKVQRKRSERARLAMKILRGVNITFVRVISNNVLA